MKNTYLFLFLLLAVVSCRDHSDIEQYHIPPPTDYQKAFADEFTQFYGLVSPEITWKTAKPGIMLVDLSTFNGSDVFTLQVLTTCPDNKDADCYLLAEKDDIHGGSISEIDYDYPTGLDYVIVAAKDTNGRLFYSHISTDSDDKVPIVIDETNVVEAATDINPMHYRICYEGFTGDDALDFDYNDLVVDVEYVRGRNNLVVNVLAAGCECAVRLLYHRSQNPDVEEGDLLFEEVHSSLGFPGWLDYVLKKRIYPILNTGLNTTGKIGTTAVELGDDYGKSITEIASNLFAYFSIPSTKIDKYESESHAFVPVKAGVQYPQAILIADPDWKWPREGMLLSADYTQFRFWLAQPEKYPLWYGGQCWKKANSVFAPPD